MSDTIGIDLGTTNCCLAYVKDNKPTIITNELGDYITPSFISFFNDEIVFGKTATSKRFQELTNTIYDVKRFIGRSFTDPCIREVRDKWHFNLIEEKGKPVVRVKNKKMDKNYTPEMLSGLLLKHLKVEAEKRLGSKVSKAVITVPTYFNDSQRQSTVDAGKTAGFEEVKLLNEPTAAAIAYATSNVSNTERTIFVFDFGGGTFDVSLLKVKNRDIRVVAIDGDIVLGGNDVTNNLVEYYAKEMKKEYNFDVYTDIRKLIRLEKTCEEVKIQLSNTTEETLQLFGFTDEDISFVLTRDAFNKINDKIFARTIEIVDRCLKRSRTDISVVDEVVVVGGSTRIKKITTLLENYFKKKLIFTINPDEAVAMGAAITASKWVGKFKNLTFEDITPYSLGVSLIGEKMSIVIPRFSKLPSNFSKEYCTTEDNQVTVTWGIYAGEDPDVEYNSKLGSLKIAGFKPGPKGSVKFDVTFICDKNGILSIEAEEQCTKIKKNLEINLDKGGLTESDLQRHMNVIEGDYEQYQNMTEFKEIRQKLTDMCNEEVGAAKCPITLAELKSITYSPKDLAYLRQNYDSVQHK